MNPEERCAYCGDPLWAHLPSLPKFVLASAGACAIKDCDCEEFA